MTSQHFRRNCWIYGFISISLGTLFVIARPVIQISIDKTSTTSPEFAQRIAQIQQHTSANIGAWDNHLLTVIPPPPWFSQQQPLKQELFKPLLPTPTPNELKINDANSSTHLNPALITQAIPLNYANATEISHLLKDPAMGVLSTEGSLTVEADTSQQTLWVHDTPTQIQKIKHLIATLDKPKPQILIEARIVDIDDQYLQKLGLLFNTQHWSNNPSSSDALGDLTIPIANLGQGVLLDATLSALAQQGHAQLVSSPKLLTLDGEAATIEAGEEIPYQQSAYNGGTSVAFKKAVLRLKVTPIIKTEQRILLKMIINQDQVANLTINGVPAINTQLLQTAVFIKNGNTLALGGIYETTQSAQHQGIPLLSKAPVVGALFRQTNQQNNRRQLLIFVTPIILTV